MTATNSAPSPRRTVREVLRSLHNWLGILFGAFLCLSSLTGSVIVFRQEIQSAMQPRLPRQSGSGAASIPPDIVERAARHIREAYPGVSISRVELPAGPREAYVFQIGTKAKGVQRVACDPFTGNILGEIHAGWLDWLVDLHHNLLSGNTGRRFTGIIGIALFAISLTGLLLWFTGNRNPRVMVTLPRAGSRRRFHFELHRMVGLWAYGVLLTISFTGIYLAYPDTFRAAVARIGGAPVKARKMKQAKVKRAAPQAALSLDACLGIGRAALPDGVARELRLPEGGKGAVTIHYWRRGDFDTNGSNQVSLDPVTGRVTSVDRAADRPVATRILEALTPIHYARWGGLPLKCLWSLFGLTPAVLFVSGLIIWRRKKSGAARPGASRQREASRVAVPVA